MRRAGPVLAAAVVALADLVALMGVARNRAGAPEAEVRLTEREIPLSPWTDENTGAFLRLEWQRAFPAIEDRDAVVRPGEARVAGLRLQLSGGGKGRARALRADGAPERLRRARVRRPRLAPLARGPRGELRRLYPDRTRCLIVPAIVPPRWTLVEEHEGARDGRAVLSGRIRRAPPRYEVRLRYRVRHEPWVAEVSPLPAIPPSGAGARRRDPEAVGGSGASAVVKQGLVPGIGDAAYFSEILPSLVLKSDTLFELKLSPVPEAGAKFADLAGKLLEKVR
ncbi:MAG TPA: DUF4824 family protein [Vicinamibacteria bacterium]|nr:DUF4824 family protein [Vicinamibacteria bacterium]